MRFGVNMKKQVVNNKKQPTAKNNTKAPVAKENTKAPMAKKTKIIITSAVAAVLLVAFVVGLVAVIVSQRDFDYLNDNLKAYIEIDKSDYVGKTITLPIDKVDDKMVQREILYLLYSEREKEAEYDGAGMLNIPITVGDEARIYYRGYTIDEEGNEVEIDRGNNMTGEIAKLAIGSGSFVPGFEEGLIGINPKEYPKFSKITSGKIMPDYVLYVSGKAIYSDGSTGEFTSKRVDLSAKNLDKEWGENFLTYMIGGKTPDGTSYEAKSIGTEIKDSVSLTRGEGTVIYTELKVNFATTCEKNPLTVETKFPADYTTESLRGATVYFDVYIKNVVVYDTPEYNDKFVTETLKITEEELKDYEGETLADKYREKIKEDLTKEYEIIRNNLIENAIWRLVTDNTEFKKFPEKEVLKQYGMYYDELAADYVYYAGQYSSIGEFAVAYYGLGEGADWTKYLIDKSKSVVAEKLCFYYVIRENNIIPSDEDFSRLYDEIVAEELEVYLENYQEELDEIEDEAQKEKRIAELRKQMINNYTKDYFVQGVHYSYAIEKIKDMFTIIEQ